MKLGPVIFGATLLGGAAVAFAVLSKGAKVAAVQKEAAIAAGVAADKEKAALDKTEAVRIQDGRRTVLQDCFAIIQGDGTPLVSSGSLAKRLNDCMRDKGYKADESNYVLMVATKKISKADAYEAHGKHSAFKGTGSF